MEEWEQEVTTIFDKLNRDLDKSFDRFVADLGIHVEEQDDDK